MKNWYKYLVGLLVTLLVAAVLMVVTAGSSQAHTGNISVTAATCINEDAMIATYKPVWANGTSSGKLSTKLGLVNSGNPWNYIADVAGTDGFTTFDMTHAKGDFSGGNGPWVSFKIVFSDNFVVQGDTRVEGFNWDKCQPVIPPQPKDKVVVTYGEWTGGDVSCLEPTATETRKVTQTTTPYIYDKKSNSWVEGTPVIVQLADESKIVKWEGNPNDCRVKPDQPKDLVVVTNGEWTGGDVSCLTPTATKTRTATQTTTPFVFDEKSWTWVEGTPVVVQLADETVEVKWDGNLNDCKTTTSNTPSATPTVTPTVTTTITTPAKSNPTDYGKTTATTKIFVNPTQGVQTHIVSERLASTGANSSSLLYWAIAFLIGGLGLTFMFGRRNSGNHK